LANVMQESGLHIERISYFNSLLFPLQVGVILFNNLFHPRSMQQSNLHTLPAGFNKILTTIMSTEAPLLKIINLPFGGSILCTVSNKSR